MGVVKVLLLGSTPEIRDMVLGYGDKVELVVCDANIEMILAMSSLMKSKEMSSKELWLKCSWLDIPIEKEYFDIIFGDAVMHNLPLELHLKFLEKQGSLLKKGGFFVQRMTQIGEIKKISCREMFEIFKQDISNDWAPVEILLSAFYLSSNNQKASLKRTKEWLGDFWDSQKNVVVSGDVWIDGVFNHEFCLGWFGGSGQTIDYPSVSREVNEMNFKKYFEIVEYSHSEVLKSKPSGIILGEYLPMYCLKK